MPTKNFVMNMKWRAKRFVTHIGHKWNSTCLLLKYSKGYEAIIADFFNSLHELDLENNLQDCD